MVLVKPATVIQWHRKGFRPYWRWRSRSGQTERPNTRPDIRNLISQMRIANPLWGCASHPWRIDQTRYRGQPGHRRTIHAVATQGPSPTGAVYNDMSDAVAVDMFVFATATFGCSTP
jgi:hypothetical protein